MAKGPKEKVPKNLIQIIAKPTDQILETLKIYAGRAFPIDIDYIDHINVLNAIDFSLEELKKAKAYTENAARKLRKVKKDDSAQAYEILALYFHNKIATKKR